MQRLFITSYEISPDEYHDRDSYTELVTNIRQQLENDVIDFLDAAPSLKGPPWTQGG